MDSSNSAKIIRKIANKQQSAIQSDQKSSEIHDSIPDAKHQGVVTHGKIRNVRDASNYVQLTDIEQILDRSDMYIGGVHSKSEEVRIYVDNSPSPSETNGGRCVKKVVTYIEGINRLYLEILSNAADNIINTRHLISGHGIEDLRKTRRPPSIRIWVTPTTIRIENGGEPIPVSAHPSSTSSNLILTPTLIFGHLRTSSNYGKEIRRVGAGRNGFGAKLTNIFSKKFAVEVKDPGNGQEYCAIWKDKMKLVSEGVRPGFSLDPQTGHWINLAIPGKRGAQKPYTGSPSVTIEYDLDFDLFKNDDGTPSITEYSSDMIAMFKRIAFDYSFTAKIKIEFNGQILDARSPHAFVQAYYHPPSTLESESLKDEKKKSIVWYEWRTREDYEAAEKVGRGKDSLIKAIESGHIANFPMVELIIIDTPGPNNFGFVNGLEVPFGVHMASAFRAITTAIEEAIPASIKSALSAVSSSANAISMSDMKQFVSIVVNCHLPDPGFRSQTKQDLEKPTPIITIPSAVFKSAVSGENRWSLTDRLMEISSFRASRLVAKTDAGKKNSNILLSKGRDANWAGTFKSNDAILFLCEGNSAKSTIEQRASLIGGNDIVGVYPMKGKGLNTTKANELVRNSNVEFREIKKLVGLKEGIDYSNTAVSKDLLRYGRIIFAADQDVDGKHIRSLLTNMFAAWPSLFREGRIGYLATPLIRVTNARNDQVVARFFSEHTFDYWLSQQPNGVLPSNLKVKYLKGLASSNMKVVREDISESPVIMLRFDPNAMESLSLAFHPKRKNDRKPWILERIASDETSKGVSALGVEQQKDIETQAVLDSKRRITTAPSSSKSAIKNAESQVPSGFRDITHMIDLDLGEYSKSTLARSIPSIDGMKQVTRQAMAHILERCNYSASSDKSTKVSQLASSVAESMHYAHGEKSLSDTIVGLAQHFIGSNNIPLLAADGQFGSRLENGKDAGAGRYIYTHLTRFATLMYDKESIELIPKRNVEGHLVEPEWLPSTLPIILINGDRGIATGFATVIPPHHPIDCANWILSRIRNLPLPPDPKPWFFNFKGRVYIESPTSGGAEIHSDLDDDDDISSASGDSLIKGGERVVTEGVFKILKHPSTTNSNYDLEITEIPIGVSIENYRTYLKSLVNAKILEKYMDWCNSDQGLVHFSLTNLNAVLLNDKDAIKAARVAYRAALKENSASITNSGKKKSAEPPAKTKTASVAKKSQKILQPPATNLAPSILSLKLQKSISRNNMVILDDHGRPHRHSTISSILETFTIKMLKHYEMFKEARINRLISQIESTTSRYNLILAIVEGRVNYKAERDVVLNQIKEQNLSQSVYLELKLNDITSDKVLALANKIKNLQEELSKTRATESWKFWEMKILELINEMESYYGISPKN